LNSLMNNFTQKKQRNQMKLIMSKNL